MKKFGVLLLAIGLVLCVVAVAKEVVLRVATWDTAEGLHWTEVAMQKFMAEHPDIKIKLESIPQGYDDRILTSLAGGNPPDVFLWWNLPVLAERGGIEPLDQYDINFDNIAPALNAWATYDGRIYGITKDYSCEVIWYNKKIFDKYGVPYPTDDWTWEDFRRIAIQLTHPEEMIYGTVFLEDPTYNLEEWAEMKGGTLISLDGTTFGGYLNSPETISAIKFWTDLVLVDKAAAAPDIVESMGGNYEMLASGRVAMIETGTWFEGYLKARHLDVSDFGVVLLPKPKDGERKNMMNTSFWCLASASKNKEAAIELLKWLADEGGRTQAEGGWALPTSKKVAEELGLYEDPIKSKFLMALDSAVLNPPFLRTALWWEAFEQYLGDALDKILIGGEPVEQALNWAVEQSEKAKGG